jgi:hypothetical protein
MNTHDPLFDGIAIPRLGIDIGRVIIRPDDLLGPEDTPFLGSSYEAAMRTPPNDDAFDVIARLADRFDGRVWLVSKCGESVQRKSRGWLDRHGFWEVTGVPREHLRFCLTRAGKRPHCEELSITHFIDDRPDVHRHLAGVVEHRLLFGPQRPSNVAPPGTIPVTDWAAVARTLLVGEREEAAGDLGRKPDAVVGAVEDVALGGHSGRVDDQDRRAPSP